MIYKKVKELYPQIKTIANEHVEKMVVLPSAWMNILQYNRVLCRTCKLL